MRDPMREIIRTDAGTVCRFGYRIASINEEESDTKVIRDTRMLQRLWALPLAPVVELRYVSTGAGTVEAQLGFGALVPEGTDCDSAAWDTALLACDVVAELRPGWVLERLGEESPLPDWAHVQGEVRRPEVMVDTPQLTLAVPDIATADYGSHGSLVAHLALAPRGSALVLAVERGVRHDAAAYALRRDMARLEDVAHGGGLHIDAEADEPRPTSSFLEVGWARRLLAARIGAGDGSYQMRVTLIGEGEPSPLLVAAASASFSGREGGGLWMPAIGADHLMARANAREAAFRPWGGGRTAYAAGLDEVLTWFRLPLAGVARDLDMRVISPASVPVPAHAASRGAGLGISVYDPTRVVALDETTRSQHCYAIGRTGCGKTTLLVNLALDDIDAGAGAFFLDPHGDSGIELLKALPRRHRDRVVLVDPANAATATTNPLSITSDADADVVIDELASMFIRLWDPRGFGEIIGPRWLRYFDAAARTLMAGPAPGSLAQMDRLFHDEAFRAAFLEWVTDDETKRFWIDEYPSDRQASEIVPWFTSKFRPFATNRLMRRVISSPDPTLDANQILREGGILVARLPKGELGPLNSSIMGTLVMMNVQAAAFARAGMPKEERHPFSLFVDEAQSYATAGMETLLAEGRKYGIRVLLANQNLDQLPDSLRRTILGNIGTLVAFRCGAADAHALQEEFAPRFHAHDLTRLQTGRAVVRTTFADGTTGVFDVQTRQPVDLTARSATWALAVPGADGRDRSPGDDALSRAGRHVVQDSLPGIRDSARSLEPKRADETAQAG